jgi:hypothetical protein
MLDRRGGFFPYAVKMAAGGDIGIVAADPGQGEHPRSTDVLSMLNEGLKSGAGNAPGDGDGIRREDRLTVEGPIRVEIEHREGLALTVFLPYAKKRLGGGATYGDLQAAPGERRIWSG